MTHRSAVSERALKRIDRFGWEKGDTAPRGSIGPMCLAATLAYVLTGQIGLTRARNMPTCVETARIIREQFPDRTDGTDRRPDSVIVHFNDHSQTTLTDVRLVLEKLAASDA